MTKNPHFVDVWYATHFDPYKEDRDKRAVERGKKYKQVAAPFADPDITMKRIVRATKTRRTNLVSVTLPKVWK